MCCSYAALLLVVHVFGSLLAGQSPTVSSDAPRRAEVPREALDATSAFQLAPGMKVALYAAEPLVANPVAFTFDEQGRCLVCETYRQDRGVEDNRGHMDWLDDDLAAQTVADRRRMYERHLGNSLESYTAHADRIRLLVDRDGNGRADRSTVFVGGFNDVLDGTGAGVLSVRGIVYYTCIPRLWAFRDSNGDGRADQRAKLLDGFGVRVAFRGHDLHGLCLGPDGRLYFSIGDRGYHVETDEGVISDPETGAVFRCELDGSGLQVVATGFRNPQELAFDDLGNLFTGDNNSDGGDQARWVHVLPGMDAGWRMAYQYLPDRGPWNRERMWEPYHPEQPAFIYPPIANLGDGPSGLAFHPGVGLPEEYIGNFFLCDFRGTPAMSGVRSFKVKPRGATFDLIDSELFLWNCLATDIAFGPEGGLYVTDWVEGWNGSGKGRIYHVYHEDHRNSQAVQEVRTLLRSEWRELKVPDLLRLLEHADQRIRQASQGELARRQSVAGLSTLLDRSQLRVARLHAVWGLGQIARLGSERATQAALKRLRVAIRDVDAEIRAAAITAVADAGDDASNSRIVAAIADENAKVRCTAAIMAGTRRIPSAVSPLVKLVLANDGADPALRHAGAMGLSGGATSEELVAMVQHPSEEVRLVAVVALRRQGRAEVATFLNDPSDRVATEAARTIHDVPISDALPQLAEGIQRSTSSRPYLQRVLNARFRLGRMQDAEALAAFAADASRPLDTRQLALNLLGQWDQPSSRDRVLGMWRPIATADRRGTDAVRALQQVFPQLLESGHELRYQAARLASQFGLAEAATALARMVEDTERDGAERAGALLSLSAMQADNLESIARAALTDASDRLRAAARIVLAQIHPLEMLPEVQKTLTDGSLLEQQSAIELLGRMALPDADDELLRLLQAVVDNQAAAATRLDIVTAARRRADDHEAIRALLNEFDTNTSPDDPLARYRVSLEGGNTDRGRRIFYDRIDLSCSRCHMIEQQGGRIGPDLSHIARDLTREQLLESLVLPSATIAKGFDNLIVTTESGRIVSGIVQDRTDERLVLMNDLGETITIPTDEIDDEQKGQSAMPDDLVPRLTPQDLRDLLEFLATRH